MDSPSLRFRDSLEEAFRLMQIHTQLTGPKPGRRRDVEVLNKAAVVFACAAFEAFVETLAKDAFSHIVGSAAGPEKLPKPILRSVASTLKEDKHELRVWDLAGDGWKSVCETYRDAVVAKYTGPFNTPKPGNIELLLRDLIGLPDLPKSWFWRGMTASEASTRLKEFVVLRGALAHGESPAPKVYKRDVERYIGFLAPLSVRASNEVRTYCHGVTGKYPWPNVRYKSIR